MPVSIHRGFILKGSYLNLLLISPISHRGWMPEHSMCSYVSMSDWNVPNMYQPRIITPNMKVETIYLLWKFCLYVQANSLGFHFVFHFNSHFCYNESVYGALHITLCYLLGVIFLNTIRVFCHGKLLAIKIHTPQMTTTFFQTKKERKSQGQGRNA